MIQNQLMIKYLGPIHNTELVIVFSKLSENNPHLLWQFQKWKIALWTFVITITPYKPPQTVTGGVCKGPECKRISKESL